MKHKLTKRSLSNKHLQPRSLPTQTRRLSTPHDHNRTLSPSKTNSGANITDSDSHVLCLKPNVPLKTQKLLKRDLLRCSNQRPSLLGVQTLQPPRIHHGSQPVHSLNPSSVNHQAAKRHGSLPDNPQTLHATIDRVGPWPDISINCLRSEGNSILQPLKNFRSTKNSRFFSPKYYAALAENNTKFKFQPKQSYIEEYRRQKGYLISSQPTPQSTSLSSSSYGRLQRSDDDQISAYGTSSNGTGSYTARDRTDMSTGNLSVSHRSMVKSAEDISDNNRLSSNSFVKTQINNLPPISIRHHNKNNHHHHHQQQQQQQQQHHFTQYRLARPVPQHALTLPTIVSSTFQYVNDMNTIEKPYRGHKKLSIQNPSQLYIIDGRQQKRY
ncbi:unnamed protein product [Adineta steineri]|uniref:Uncharacterized protein n=1 Tax=Adineta steineri TaxID=433720 RepID=A0A818UU58_9BILA|nr:unnamed protein product [Adineta steineri]CAF3702940.1 unnamed protein product [Adineta steineri]